MMMKLDKTDAFTLWNHRWSLVASYLWIVFQQMIGKHELIDINQNRTNLGYNKCQVYGESSADDEWRAATDRSFYMEA